MKAVKFDNSLELIDTPKPVTEKDHALVKILMSGICNTDIEIIRGYMGFNGILGHEFVGVVESAENKELIGKRVVGEINLGCGECEYCLCGLERHCPDRRTIGIWHKDGAHAEYITIPVKNLLFVPDEVEDREAVFVEPLAAALEILEQVKVEPTYKIAIFGDGKLGLLIAQVLRLTGASLTVIGKSERKLSLAKEFGVKITFADNNVEKKYDIVVEASGSPGGLVGALNALKPRGMLVLKSTYHEEIQFNPAVVVINEITIVGSRCGRFEPALRLLEQNLVDVKPLISKVYSINQAIDAFDYAQRPDVLKVILDYR